MTPQKPPSLSPHTDKVMQNHLSNLSAQFGDLCYQRDQMQTQLDAVSANIEATRAAINHALAMLPQVKEVETLAAVPQKPEGLSRSLSPEQEQAIRADIEQEMRRTVQAEIAELSTKLRAQHEAMTPSLVYDMPQQGKKRGRKSNAERAALAEQQSA